MTFTDSNIHKTAIKLTNSPTDENLSIPPQYILLVATKSICTCHFGKVWLMDKCLNKLAALG
jgi:hypothetical protein